MAKTTMVELEVKYGHLIRKEPFGVRHAERILCMSNNGGWALPKDSKFELREGKLSRKKAVKRKTK